MVKEIIVNVHVNFHATNAHSFNPTLLKVFIASWYAKCNAESMSFLRGLAVIIPLSMRIVSPTTRRLLRVSQKSLILGSNCCPVAGKPSWIVFLSSWWVQSLWHPCSCPVLVMIWLSQL